jgi:ketosteroid isomerase-like protein
VTPAEVVRAYVAALNAHDPDAVALLVTEDFHNEHTSVLGTSLHGRAAYRERLPAFLRAFEGLHYELEDVITEGDRAAAPYTLTARCAGPDGAQHPVRIRGMFRFRVAGDLVAHRVDYWDSAEFTRQVSGPGKIGS